MRTTIGLIVRVYQISCPPATVALNFFSVFIEVALTMPHHSRNSFLKLTSGMKMTVTANTKLSRVIYQMSTMRVSYMALFACKSAGYLTHTLPFKASQPPDRADIWDCPLRFSRRTQ